MRRATDKTYPQNTSQIAIYAAARKFKFFMIFSQLCIAASLETFLHAAVRYGYETPASEEAGYSIT
jgi:membrane-associated PAP2 superfamily phosphatase